MKDWLNVLLSISSGALSQAEKDQLANVQCSWVLLNVRLGRFFVDVLGPVNRLQNIRDKLTELGRDPIIVGVFTPTQDVDGTWTLRLTQHNNVEYLKVAPDLVGGGRPTSYVQTHKWMGWPDKVFP